MKKPTKRLKLNSEILATFHLEQVRGGNLGKPSEKNVLCPPTHPCETEHDTLCTGSSV
jgi:hypothetical protein